MRRPSAFKKSYAVRAMNAVQAAGLEVARLEVRPDGSIVVVPGKLEEMLHSDTNPWDHVLWDADQKRTS